MVTWHDARVQHFAALAAEDRRKRIIAYLKSADGPRSEALLLERFPESSAAELSALADDGRLLRIKPNRYAALKR